MLQMTAAGGTALLVTELVSSDSCRELLSVSECELPDLLRRELSARNFFTGTNPATLGRLLKTESPFREQVTQVRFTDPWLWPFVARTYAVYAVLMRKS